MSLTFSTQKATEQELQNCLYENIRLLTQIYPTTKEFDAQLRKDMFAKNNKAGFFQVVYYLLWSLNPTLTKTRIKSWPIYDLKMESNFRRELLQFINELNSLYETADIPTIMTSQLISPSGIKFLTFMLKLSQLVIVEYLAKNNVEFLKPLKPDKNEKTNQERIKNIQKKTRAIETETRTKYDKYNKELDKLQLKATKIISILSKYEHKIKEIKENMAKVEKTEGPLTEEHVSLELEKFEEKTNMLQEMHELVDGIVKVHSDFISQPITGENKLNIIEDLNNLVTLLTKCNLELPSPPKSVLIQYTSKLSEINEKLRRSESTLLEIREQILTIDEEDSVFV